RVAAYVVVVPGIKAVAVRVKPSLDRTKDPALEDRPRVARPRMRAEMEATLKNRVARAAAGRAVGDSGAADPGADDRHINCVGQVTHSSDRRGACCSLYLKQQREAGSKGSAATSGRCGSIWANRSSARERRESARNCHRARGRGRAAPRTANHLIRSECGPNQFEWLAA